MRSGCLDCNRRYGSDRPGCTGTPPKSITVATTTSTRDSGLLDELLPVFQATTGIEVRVVAVGTGQALEIGRRGDADVILTHDPAGEARFVAAGFGTARSEVMTNDFVLVGPPDDPAGVKRRPSSGLPLSPARGAVFDVRLARRRVRYAPEGEGNVDRFRDRTGRGLVRAVRSGHGGRAADDRREAGVRPLRPRHFPRSALQTRPHRVCSGDPAWVNQYASSLSTRQSTLM